MKKLKLSQESQAISHDLKGVVRYIDEQKITGELAHKIYDEQVEVYESVALTMYGVSEEEYRQIAEAIKATI